MGKFKDNCKKYVGMTAIAALSLFGGANEAQAKQTSDDFHLGTRTTTVETRDYNITDSTYTHHYETSMQVFDGGKMDSFRPCPILSLQVFARTSALLDSVLQ